MIKQPITATWAALFLALAVNLIYYSTATELTSVVTRTLFIDWLLVLTMVPVYESIRIRNAESVLDIPQRIKSGMKPVSVYTLLLALVTYGLFSVYGEPLVEAKMALGIAELDQAVADGIIDQNQADQKIDSARQIYSAGFYMPVILLSNLFVGFLSSLLAAFVIKK